MVLFPDLTIVTALPTKIFILGGIINRIGTYQMAIVAKACGKPLYVAAESYKFSRMFPLYQALLWPTTLAHPNCYPTDRPAGA